MEKLKVKPTGVLIAGLGNPGSSYKTSRHNLGFKVVEELAKRLEASFRFSIRLECNLAKIRFARKDLFLALPQVFMNNSGRAVKKIIQGKKVLLKDMLIISDDLDLDFGRMRLRAKGSDAGHRGVRSIIQALKREDFARLRVGIGRPERNTDLSEYVLSNFSAEEKEMLPSIIDKAVGVSLAWVKDGITLAMTKCGGKIC